MAQYFQVVSDILYIDQAKAVMEGVMKYYKRKSKECFLPPSKGVLLRDVYRLPSLRSFNGESTITVAGGIDHLCNTLEDCHRFVLENYPDHKELWLDFSQCVKTRRRSGSGPTKFSIMYGFSEFRRAQTGAPWYFMVEIGLTHPAFENEQVRLAFIQEALQRMGIAGSVQATVGNAGFEWRSQHGFLAKSFISAARDEHKVPLRFEISGFPGGAQLITAIEQVLPFLEVTMDRMQIVSHVLPGQYEELLGAYNRLSKIWNLGWYGQLAPGIDPYASPQDLPPDAPTWIPLMTVNDKLGYIGIDIVRERDGLVLQFNAGRYCKADRLVQRAEEITGIPFKVLESS